MNDRQRPRDAGKGDLTVVHDDVSDLSALLLF